MRIHLYPSKQFFIITLLILSITLLIIICSPFLWFIKIILIAVTLAYGGHLFFRYIFLRSPHSIIGLSQNTNGWVLHQKNQLIQPLQLSGDSTLTNYVAILRFTQINKRFKQTCIVWKDSLDDPDTYRKLVVACRAQE